MSFLDKLFNDNKKEEESSFFDDSSAFLHEDSLEDIIKNKSIDFIKTKIDSSNFAKEDEDNKKALYYATIHKRVDVLNYLFELGSDFQDAKKTKGSSAISTIIQSKSIDVLSTFINYGYKIEVESLSVLAIASKLAPLEFIKFLIKLDVPMISYEDGFDKFTPLECALMNKREYHIFEALIQAGCPLNEEDNTSFVCQLIYSNLEPNTKAKVLHLLHNLNKLDLNQVDKDNNSLLKLAIQSGDTRSLKELILLGADYKDFHHEIKRMLCVKDLEDIAIEFEKKAQSIEEFLSLLPKSSVENYIDKTKDLSNKTTIYQIVTNARLTEVEKLYLLQKAVSKNASIELTEKKDTNVLYEVCKSLDISKDICVARFLLEKGAKIEASEYSALFYAVYNYHLPLINLLLEFKANVNFIDKNNEGVIKYFYKENSVVNSISKKREVLKLLVDSGLNINTKCSCKEFFKETKKEEEEYKEDFISFFTLFIIHNEHKVLEYILDDLRLEITDDDSIFYAIVYLRKDEILKKIIKINPYYIKKDFYKYEEKTEDANIILLGSIYLSLKSLEYLVDTYSNLKAYSEIKPIILEFYEHRFFTLEFIEKMIKKDSNINRYYTFKDEYGNLQKQTILSYIVKKAATANSEHKSFKVVELLLKNGADVNCHTICANNINSIKNISIFIEAFNKEKFNKHLLDLLYEYGASLATPIKESLNEMPIQSLIQRYITNDDLAFEYLEYCFNKDTFDLEHKNSHDTTIFLSASMSCLPKTLTYLANKGANIKITGGVDNLDALHKAIVTYPHVATLQRAKAVVTLVKLGLDIEKFSAEQKTALMAACNVGAREVVKELILLGANVNAINDSNQNAVHHAVIGQDSYDFSFRFETNKSKIIIDLAKAGANINLCEYADATPLIYAIKSNCKEIFDTLLNLNADINTFDYTDTLPLYYALLIKDLYFINMLYKTKKLDVNKANKFNYTVLHQLLVLDFHNKIFEEILETLINMDFDINYHQGIEPALLMYVKTMNFVSQRSVGFVKSEKKPKENEDKIAKLFVKYKADVQLCIDIANKQNESDDIINYLQTLINL